MKRVRFILKWVLILSGMFLMLAFLAALLPVHWMAVAHQWLGLGDFPDQPITIYLARSTSLLYGVHGVLMLYTGMTLDRHWQLVRLFGWLHVLIGLSMLVIDLTAPMPWYWTLIEGGPIASLGVLILLLAAAAFEPVSESVNAQDQP